MIPAKIGVIYFLSPAQRSTFNVQWQLPLTVSPFYSAFFPSISPVHLLPLYICSRSIPMKPASLETKYTHKVHLLLSVSVRLRTNDRTNIKLHLIGYNFK